MKVYPIFSSFSSGEITPLLKSRSDTDAYKNGVEIMRNMTSTSHGPSVSRIGTKYSWYNDPSVDGFTAVGGRIMDFSISKTRGTFVFIFLLDDGTTRILPFDTDGKVIDPAIELVKNSYFDQGASDWPDVSFATGDTDFSNGQAVLIAGSSSGQTDYSGDWVAATNAAAPGAGIIAIGDVTLLRVNKTDNGGGDRGLELLTLKADDTINLTENADASRYTNYIVTGTAIDQTTFVDIPVLVSGAGGGIRNAQVTTMDWVEFTAGSQRAGIEQEITGTINGNNLDLTVYTQNDISGASTVVTVGTTQGGNDLHEGSYRGDKYSAEFLNTGGTSVWLTVYTATDEPTKILDAISMYDSTLTLPQDKGVIFTGPWTEDDLQELQYDTPPEGNGLYISSPLVPLQVLLYDETANAWTFEPVTLTGAPTEWVTGSYPRAITFYQGRLWLGGSPNNRETFWASKSGNITNFTQGELADDGLEFTMDEHGQIEWIVGAKNLVIGTASGEHIVQATDGVIIPSDIQISQQSAYGFKQMQPEKIGQDVLYVSPDGRKMREISYKWTDDGWISRDITFASEHITKANRIKRIAFAQNPGNQIIGVTIEGNFVACTYEKTYSVIGWHRHDTTGTFVDVASVDINGDSVVGFLVGRAVDGTNRMFFETFDTANRYRMDSHLYQDYPAETTELTGLEHLAGAVVDVLTDTGVHPPIEVAADGTATLQWTAREVVTGYNIHAHMRTLSPDVIGPDGSSHAYQKGWGTVYVRVLESGKPLINGHRASERHPATLMNTPEPQRSEDIKSV